MKVEIIDADGCQDRVLLLFEEDGATDEVARVDEYLSANNLSPKREYTENRDGTDYRVYYFGQCYIGSHVERLEALAGESA